MQEVGSIRVGLLKRRRSNSQEEGGDAGPSKGSKTPRTSAENEESRRQGAGAQVSEGELGSAKKARLLTAAAELASQRRATSETCHSTDPKKSRAETPTPCRSQTARSVQEAPTVDIFYPFSPPRKSKPKASPKRSPKTGTLPKQRRDPPSGSSSTQSPSALSPASQAPSVPLGASVKELKAKLASNSIDASHCVEKSELEALWQRFQLFTKKPLRELQDLCYGHSQERPATVEACARLLLKPPLQQAKVPPQAKAPAFEPSKSVSPPEAAARAKPQAAAAPPPRAPEPESSEAGQRDKEALEEVRRILPLRREGFHTSAAWGFAVLGASKEAGAVQRCYRGLMRKLHPDRVTQSEMVVKTIELIREAKDLCERSLLQVAIPSPPRNLRSETISPTVGSRQFRLLWDRPAASDLAPVRRYIIAAFDPAYGRALTITVLEPDYSEELRRYVAVDELTQHILAESELQKMPLLWQQKMATVQVAASNEAGQSQWATLQVPLVPSAAAPKQPEARRGPPQLRPAPAYARPPKPAYKAAASFFPAEGDSQSEDSSSSTDSQHEDVPQTTRAWAANSNDLLRQKSTRELDGELLRRQGIELGAFLRRQVKANLADWLASKGLRSMGNKEELVQRIAEHLALNARKRT